MKRSLLVFLAMFTLVAHAKEKDCRMDKAQQATIEKYFSGKDHLHSLLWWSDPSSKVINARSFIINGRDSIPIFSSEADAKKQVAGSGFEKDIVSIDPRVLASILQSMEYAILNPGGSVPIQFKTCIVKPYASVNGC